MFRLAFAFLAVMAVLGIVSKAFSNEDYAGAAPSRAVALKAALDQQTWQEVSEGLAVVRALDSFGNGIIAYRIDPEILSFDIALTDRETGGWAQQVGEREGALLAVNAGFFAATEQGKLYPVGYLRLGERRLAKGWASAGGVLSIANGRIELVPTYQGIPKTGDASLQTKPMLVEPGGKWAMRSNAGVGKRRTILCRMEDGVLVVALVFQGGLTLFEAGWLMRRKEHGGYFNCDSALALDGGRSTQIWVSGQSDLSLAGIVPVHNFLVVKRRKN